MSIADLTGALISEADAEAEAILARARAEAEAVARDTNAARRERRDRELAAWRDRCEGEARNRLAATAARMRAEVLRARAGALDRVRAAVAARLPQLLDDPAVAAAVVARALAVAGDRALAIRCAPALVERARASTRAEVIADPAVGSGVAVELTGGRAEVTVTLEAVLERAWPGLQIDALAAIDAGEVTP